MLEVSNLALPLDAGLPAGERLVRRAAAAALGVAVDEVRSVRLLKRSVDARRRRDVHFVATVGVELVDARAEEAALFVASSRKGAGVTPGTQVRRHEPYRPLDVTALERAHAASGEPRPVVVGAGPAGLFCALYLARAGLAPLLLERGADVDARLAAVEAFDAGGELDVHANIQFGEGGAGTFSDGKLTTNIKSPFARHVLRWFVDAGAPEEILWQAKPHIGTDLLVDVVRTMREQIREAGGEVRFGARVSALRFSGDSLAEIEVEDVRTGSVDVLPARRVVLACGHSARDTFQAVFDAGVLMEQKPFSVGVRIEHAQSAVNRAQYGAAASHPALGAADYKLSVHLDAEGAARAVGKEAGKGAAKGTGRGSGKGTAKRAGKGAGASAARMPEARSSANRAGSGWAGSGEGRGVYTFCMCPGGEVVCAASEEGGVVVNGMSRYARDGRNANSALLVGVGPADFEGDHPLAGVELQRRMERAAYRVAMEAGGAPYQAPAQTVGDFLAHRAGGPSATVRPTYARGVAWCDLHDCLPGFVSDALERALPLLDRRMRGFADEDAVLTGVETRSSSPVRIVRDASCQVLLADVAPGRPVARGDAEGVGSADGVGRAEGGSGLYPCGEGAGYAGGIMSAACDGLRVARAVCAAWEWDSAASSVASSARPRRATSGEGPRRATSDAPLPLGAPPRSRPCTGRPRALLAILPAPCSNRSRRAGWWEGPRPDPPRGRSTGTSPYRRGRRR